MTHRLAYILNLDQPLTLTDAYRAIFSWALVAGQRGTFIMCVNREPEDEDELWAALEPLEWLGLDWDEGIDVDGPYAPYILGARAEAYMAAAEKLSQLDQQRQDLPELTAVVDTQAWQVTHQLAFAQLPIQRHLYDLVGHIPPETFPVPPLTVEAPLWLGPEPIADPTLADLRAAGVQPRALLSALLAAGWAGAPEATLLTRYAIAQQLTEAQLGATARLTAAGLAHYNRLALESLPLAQLAAGIRPELEEVFGDLPASPAWLEELTRLVRPALSFFSEAPELAGWAFADGYEFSAEATALLRDPALKRPLLTLMAELSPIVLLDQATAAVILAKLAQRFPALPLEQAVRAALSGRLAGPPLDRLLGLLGKAECLRRLGAAVA